MNIYFSGIGGAGIGPLALLAHQAGYTVSGSDKQHSEGVAYLQKHGIDNIYIGQSGSEIAQQHEKQPIDWFVQSSAIEKENPNHPELLFVKEKGIKSTKRDELIATLLQVSDQQMIGIAGTHGKTTTTAMTIWLFQELNIPVSYLLGGKISFADAGHFDRDAQYFIYEADEYDRNFLRYEPLVSLIPGLSYDHPDIYPTQEEYNEAFLQYFDQSQIVVLWERDATKLHLSGDKYVILNEDDIDQFTLLGKVNRLDALMVAKTASELAVCSFDDAVEILNRFPGVVRRFEKISDNIFTDYAHTPEKIRGAIEVANEASDSVVVVYEGLHNTRQHFIKDKLPDLFHGADKLYVVPSYLAREDESLEMLTPEKLCDIIQDPTTRVPSGLNDELKSRIKEHAENGELVICLSAGGGGSLDEWLRLQDWHANEI